jgi:hypothetical protein
LTDEAFEFVDLLLVALRRCLPREDVGGVFEQLLTPADDNGIGELMLAAEGSERLVTFECGECDLGFELGGELTRLGHTDGS